MTAAFVRPTGTKPAAYRALAQMAEGLFAGERDPVANAANLAALIFHSLPDLNWAGFYFLQNRELVLGPFQGLPACIRIPVGRGVCGTAAERREPLIVQDVQSFPGHIACDAASRSELVVPLISNGGIAGVLDLDSPHLARFDEEDREGCVALAGLWTDASDLALLPKPWDFQR